ncbi:MAG: arginine N-succinyltransferase [Pseudomonadota bacterium]|nr:arginine N-succinyltransferase [Pseudomonadota bacterium]
MLPEYMTGKTDDKNQTKSKWPRILGIIALFFIVVITVSVWWIKHNLYANPFNPTKLNEREQQVLNTKLERLEQSFQKQGKFSGTRTDEEMTKERLEPEDYTEDPARREIRISEKELNALIAKDEKAARQIAINLSDDMISLKLIIPVDKDIPFLGGKTLRLSCGVTLRHEAGKPVVALRGVSIGGIPIPNAWLGNLKNVDLVHEFNGQHGFWGTLSKGVEDIKVSNGSLSIKLRE